MTRSEGLKESLELIQAAKKLGVKRLRYGSLEVEFAPRPAQRVQMSEEQLKKMAAMQPEMPTADDLMFWSTGDALPSEIRKAQQEAQDAMTT